MQTLTFKPIAGNRYKCNQTGDIVTNCQNYSFSYLRRKHNENAMKDQGSNYGEVLRQKIEAKKTAKAEAAWRKELEKRQYSYY